MQALCIFASQGILLIPVSIVAHIVNLSNTNSYDSPVAFANTSINWQDFELPVVSSSGMLGGEMDPLESIEKAVIIWPVSGTQTHCLFAFTSLKSPVVVELQDDSSERTDFSEIIESLDKTYVMGYTSVGDQIAVIPDLKNLSSTLFNN